MLDLDAVLERADREEARALDIYAMRAALHHDPNVAKRAADTLLKLAQQLRTPVAQQAADKDLIKAHGGLMVRNVLEAIHLDPFFHGLVTRPSRWPQQPPAADAEGSVPADAGVAPGVPPSSGVLGARDLPAGHVDIAGTLSEMAAIAQTPQPAPVAPFRVAFGPSASVVRPAPANGASHPPVPGQGA